MKNNEAYRNSIEQKADGIIQKRKQRNRTITGVTSAAACLALVICTIMFAPGLWGTDPIIDNPGISGPASTGSEQQGQMSVVNMNAISESDQLGASRIMYDPNTTFEETWDWDRVIEYFGKDITPSYITAGLKPNPRLTEQTVIINNDGTMALDTIWMQFFTFYYEDGSQGVGGGSTGIQIVASKIGHPSCAIYLWPEDMKETLLNDVSVRFGHMKMGWGGFEDAEDYYDFFVAEFTKDGINFEVTASNISETEFIKVVDSLTR